MKTSFVDLFDKLDVPASTDKGTLNAVRVVKSDWRVCKDLEGRPGLLLPASSEGGSVANYLLQHLQVVGSLPCRIVDEDGQTISGHFASIRCLSGDREIQEYFLHVAEMLVDALPLNASASDVLEAIERLVALFRAISQPSRKSAAGLWGELFLIVNSREPYVLLKSWHGEANEEVDFSDGRQRLEVKCSSDGTRRHHFSLEQLTPPSGSNQVVASMLLEAAAGGKSLKELWEMAREVASGDSDLLYKIESSCAAMLGPDWQDSVDFKYDEQRATESLRFYDVQDVPKIQTELPRGVTEVRFKSDLDLATPLRIEDLGGMGTLYGSAVPTKDRNH
jgi:hypothetical protein